MAHNKVYGICENKCQVEVLSKEETMSQFDDKADNNHASTSEIYGLATTNEYGHVKLTQSTTMPTGNQDGIALAGSMGYTLSQRINDAKTAMRIPVNGVFLSTYIYQNSSRVNEILGYGTWDYLGGISGEGAEVFMVHAYVRTA